MIKTNNIEKSRMLSLIQPTGTPTLGNYLGALKTWVSLQDKFEGFFGVADLHSITVKQLPADLRRNSYEIFALLLAIGLDPEKNVIFLQSHVKEHAELAWILSCYTQFGELSRMTQFKDKSAKNSDNINLGLFSYPTLMAADILLYQPKFVPVGEDQKQHLEITRDIAERFNHSYPGTFTIPEPYILNSGARIRSLQDPIKKMSKSDENVNSFISVKDDADTILRKFKRAVTDSDAKVFFSEDKPGVANLMEIYSVITGRSMDKITAEFDGKGYGDFKSAVAETVASELRPVQIKFDALIKDKAYLEDTMRAGCGKAVNIAYKTIKKVKKKIGFVQI